MSVIGIDFGTAFSFPSFLSDGKPTELLNTSVYGTRGIPSVFYYDRLKGIIIGTDALRCKRSAKQNCVEYIKHSLGESSVLSTSTMTLDDRQFTKQEICAHILKSVVDIANAQLDVLWQEPATEAVITVPVKFGHKERTIIRNALETPKTQGGPGLKLKGFLPEPVAAAITFAENTKRKNRVLVFDLGAGTFDIALLQPTPEERQPYKVVDNEGINHGAAGNDFDKAFAAVLTGRFATEKSIYVQNESNYSFFLDEAKSVKEKLSADDKTFFTYQYRGDMIELTVTRAEFEQATKAVLQKSLDMTTAFVKKHNLINAGDLDVVLVGGSSYMLKVKSSLQTILGSNVKIGIYRPEMAISFGAAHYAANAGVVMQIAPHSYGIRINKTGTDIKHLSIMLKRNQPLPTGWIYGDYSTSTDQQTSTCFAVYETDRLEECEENQGRELFNVTLKWDNPVPQGTSCPAEMRLSEDGTLEIRAINSESGKKFNGSFVIT